MQGRLATTTLNVNPVAHASASSSLSALMQADALMKGKLHKCSGQDDATSMERAMLPKARPSRVPRVPASASAVEIGVGVHSDTTAKEKTRSNIRLERALHLAGHVVGKGMLQAVC